MTDAEVSPVGYEVTVELAGAGQAGEAGRVLADSHADYPAFRHLFPDPAQRRRVLVPFMTATAGDAARHGRCYLARVAEEAVAVALWMPPGTWPMSGRRKLRVAPGLLPAMWAAGRRASAWVRTGTALESHTDHEPGWYLQALGVGPALQRRGIGRRLLVPVLTEADRDGVPCLLHTSDPANAGYYRRFGFTVAMPLTPVFPGGPAYLAMRRAPRYGNGEATNG